VDDEKRGREVALICPTCGSSQFSYDEEGDGTSIVTCAECGRETTQDDLVRDNSENLEAHAAEVAEEAISESVRQFNKSLRDAFEGNKDVGFK
jgi:uncharacterized Zn finger protein (UPF0148 family)